jgi:hypothetical protein
LTKAGIDATDLLPASTELQWGDAIFMDDYRGVGLYYAAYRIPAHVRDKEKEDEAKKGKWSDDLDDDSSDDELYSPSEDEDGTPKPKKSTNTAASSKAVVPLTAAAKRKLEEKKKRGAVGPDDPSFVDRVLVHGIEEYGYLIPYEFADAPIGYYIDTYDMLYHLVDPMRYNPYAGFGPFIAQQIAARKLKPTYTGMHRIIEFSFVFLL